MKECVEYQLVSKFYENQVAARSGVPMINHINEGITILEHLGAEEDAIRAFIAHPLFQDDRSFNANYEKLDYLDEGVVKRVMLYRLYANAYLSERVINTVDDIEVHPLVHDMLVADKIQNFKDFEKYHADTHPRRMDLARYFYTWFVRLDLPFKRIVELTRLIEGDV